MSTRIVNQRPSEIDWNNLKSVDDALTNAYLDLSRENKTVSIGGKLYSFQEVINRVYRLGPKLGETDQSYTSVVRKLKKISEQDPFLEQKSLARRIFEVFTCCGWTYSCRETEILEYGHRTSSCCTEMPFGNDEMYDPGC